MQMGMVGPGRTGASMYDLNLPDITEVWRRGSVIASWLLDLTSSALAADPDLKTFAGRVSDSGEGRWTIIAAIDEGVPAYVLSAALYERFSSRGQADFADQVLSAMRYQFGGHPAAASREARFVMTAPSTTQWRTLRTTALSALLAIPPAQIATIGDMPNDVLMFERSGVSIAMANASVEVQRAATSVTTSNTDEGFALAMERFVLGVGAAH
jgi:hypothetical protein